MSTIAYEMTYKSYRAPSEPSVFRSPSAEPRTVTSPQVVTIRGLSVHVAWDDDQWLAIEIATQMFGEGDTPDEAYRDLFQSLKTYRSELQADASPLAPRLFRHLQLLDAALDR
jgi:hypothetical protein